LSEVADVVTVSLKARCAESALALVPNTTLMPTCTLDAVIISVMSEGKTLICDASAAMNFC